MFMGGVGSQWLPFGAGLEVTSMTCYMYEPMFYCIRICADIKTTVNPHLQMKTFPLPTPDEVFSTLAHGQSFSKLDLARAYKQIEVEESSRPYLTINMHLGLFRYRRLPFGIASAPAIWQKAMSVVLKGCQGTICYIDDILVTGKTRSPLQCQLPNQALL